MLEQLNVITGLATTVICGLVAYPLRTAINGLSKNVDRLASKIDDNNREINELRERTARVEASAKQAHKRVDAYEVRIREIEHRCNTCTRKGD